MRGKKTSVVLLLCLGLLLPWASALYGKTTFLTIGSGNVTGVYYPLGQAIAKIINRNKDEKALSYYATVESTTGSVFNVAAVLSGQLDFWIVQADSLYKVMGQGTGGGKNQKEALCSVCTLHTESVTLVAAVDAGIFTLGDLLGKRVCIGPENSSPAQNALDALSQVGLAPGNGTIDVKHCSSDDFVKKLKSEDKSEKIDAFFHTIGHPATIIGEATSAVRKVRLIDLSAITPELRKEKPFYVETLIPVKRLYPGAVGDEQVRTLGVKAILVVSKKTSEDVVESVTRKIFENLDELKGQHRSLVELTPEGMRQGLTVPLHPGAKRYYTGKGWPVAAP